MSISEPSARPHASDESVKITRPTTKPTAAAKPVEAPPVAEQPEPPRPRVLSRADLDEKHEDEHDAIGDRHLGEYSCPGREHEPDRKSVV